MKYKIIQKRAECIGCGACVAMSNNWRMGPDNKAKPKKGFIEEKEFKSNKEAADVCPVRCIEIVSHAK